MKLTKRWVAWLALFLLWLLSGQAIAVPGPKETIQGLLDSVRILSQSPKGNPDLAVIKRISEMMDIAGVSKECLGPYCQRLPPQEQKAFVRLFQEVLEKVAYPKSAKFFKDTKIDIGKVSEESDRAYVLTTVTDPKEGKVEVGYQLRLINGKWLIEDVVLDGVSLVQDLRAQMQKIIKEKSYAELKRKLTEKLHEESAS